VAFVGLFNLQDLVGHHWDSRMRGGVHPAKAWARLEKDENLVDIIQTSKVTYAKPLKVAWGARN
jgi:hypothetical protein